MGKGYGQVEYRGMTVHSSILIRLGYVAILVFMMILAAIMRDWGKEALNAIPSMTLNCVDCVGVLFVFRVSFVLCLFFSIHSLATIGLKVHEGDPRASFNNGWWIPKIIFIAAVLVACLFIPNDAFLIWGEIARVLAVPYILIQVVYMVLLGFYWNDSWINKDPPWFWQLVVCSLSLLFVSFAMIICLYVFFASAPGCGVNIAFITLCLLFCIAMVAGSIAAEHGSLVTASIVCSYVVFMTWSALQSEPYNDDFQCNKLFNSTSSEAWVAVLGVMFTIIASVYSAFGAASRGSDPFAEKDDTQIDYSPAYFHLVLALASAYIAMLLSNWEIGKTQDELTVDKGWTSAAVKLVTALVACLIYAWTLAAPYVCPNREFSFAPQTMV